GDPLWRLRVSGIEDADRQSQYMWVREVHDGVVLVAFSGFLVAADAVSGDLRWAVEIESGACDAAGSDVALWVVRCDGIVEHRAWEDGRTLRKTTSPVGDRTVTLLLAPDGAAIALVHAG